MKKFIIALLASFSLLCLAAFAVSCGETDDGTSESQSDSAQQIDAEYTVAFSADGVVTETRVKRGDAAVRPAEPSKEGSSFYGWYTDGTYSTLFDFSTPIMSDVTLYARFVEFVVSEDEYVVTFYDGNEVYDTRSTVGGVVEVPDRQGTEGFVGWWVSAYNDGEKLTAEYGGEELMENTSMYAVYDKGQLIVNVRQEGIFWNGKGANEQYFFSVTDPDGNTVSGKTTALDYIYDFDLRKAGDYEVSVSVNGKTTKAYYRNKTLPRVSYFKVADSVLVFNEVTGAEAYSITVDCGDDEHVHTDVDLGGATAYDFSNCEMQEGGIRFTVKATSASLASSYAEYVYERRLSGIDLTLDEATDLIAWNPVDNAEGYVVAVTSGGSTEETDVGKATEFSLKEYAGDLTVTVSANAWGYNPASDTLKYSKTRLATPGDVRMVNDVISWTAVDGATGYKVRVGEMEHVVSGTSFDLSKVYTPRNGYDVYVMATGAANSLYSDAITVSSGITGLAYSDGYVSWNHVVNAAGYLVKVNGGEAIEISDGSVGAEVSLDRAGENVISVAYINNKGKVSDYSDVKVNAYAVNFVSEEGTEVASQYYAVGDAVSLPDSQRVGYDLAGWYRTPGGAKANAAKYGRNYFDGNTNITLYASWSPKTYIVTLDTGSDALTAEVRYYEEFVLPVPEITDPLKGFIGWYASTDPESMVYSNADGTGTIRWTFASGLTLHAIWVDVFKFNLIDNGAAYSVSKGDGAERVSYMKVPAEYNGKPVTTIEGSAFYNCRYLVTLDIPDTITNVETGTAFINCSRLTNINVYETGSPASMRGAYYSQDGVLFRDNPYDSVMEIKYYPQNRRNDYYIPAFITIPDGNGGTVDRKIEQLPVGIFRSSYMTEVHIPYTVRYVQANAFYSSSRLTKVVFEDTPEGETEVPLYLAENAFRSCKSLTSLTVPTRLSDISSATFAQCTALEYINIIGTSADYASVEGFITDIDRETLIYAPLGRKGTVRIPLGITKIADNAFRTEIRGESSSTWNAATGVTAVIFPAYVAEIGDSAFYGCTGIRRITFEGKEDDYALTIGDNAFYGCTGIREVTLPENLAYLGAAAFAGNKNLNRVNIETKGDMASVLYNGAFTDPENGNCYVSTLTIGAKVGEISISNAFSGTSISKITVDPANTAHVMDDDVMYRVDETGTKVKIEFFPVTKQGAFVIPDTVVSVDAKVFEFRVGITEVTIGTGVATIAANAFENCLGLTKVNFADGCTVSEIGAEAFKNCTNLAEITLPASLAVLGNKAFDGCDVLAEVGVDAASDHFVKDEYGLLYTKDMKFLLLCPKSNEGINGKVVIPAGVENVASGVFTGNTGIREIEFEGCPTFGEGVFANISTIQSVKLPSTLTAIPQNMFFKCSGLTSVTIPKTVTTIGRNAFYGCVNLASVEFESGRTEALTIADGYEDRSDRNVYSVFGSTRSLEEITIPANTRVGMYAFNSSAVSTATLGDNVTLCAYAFANSDLTSVTFSGTWNGIDVTCLENGYIDAERSTDAQKSGAYGAFMNCAKLTDVDYGGATVEYIPPYIFQNCTSLVDVVIPDTVKEIGAYAYNNTGVVEVVIPANVEVLWSGSNPQNKTLQSQNAPFAGCRSLTKVTFAEGSPVDVFSAGMFTGCSKLKEIVGMPDVVRINDNALYNTALASITLPETLTEIRTYAFYGTKLASVVLPASLEVIGSSAFGNCKQLVSVNFAEGSQLKSMAANVFINDTALTSFTFPEVKDEDENVEKYTVAAGPFKGCTKFTKLSVSASAADNFANIISDCTKLNDITVSAGSGFVSEGGVIYDEEKTTLYKAFAPTETDFVVPDTVVKINANAFQNNATITSVTIPSSVTLIGNYAFNACTALKTVNMSACDGESSQTIGTYAFDGCKALTTVDLPYTLTTIGNYGFRNCSALTSITFENDPDNDRAGRLSSLGSNMFNGCSKLTNIDLPESLSALPMYAFNNCTSLTEITMPNVKTLAGYSFANTGFTEFSFDSVENYVNASVCIFQNCKNLTKVDFSNSKATRITKQMFQGCTALKDVILSDKLIRLGSNCFQGCTALESIDLTYVTELSNLAGQNDNFPTSMFIGCTSLKDVTLGSDLRLICNQMFDGCISLESINIPDGIEQICFAAFRNTALREVIIPESVTELGAQSNTTFSGEKGSVFYNCASLEKVDLPDSLETIYDNTFYGTAISEIFFPANLSTVSTSAFAGAADLKDVYIDVTNMNFEVADDGVVYNGDGDVAFFPGSVTGTVTIRSGARIPAYAFSGNAAITEVILPDDVNIIPDYAFYGAIGLEKVTIPYGVMTIGSYAFANCPSLEEIVLPDSVVSLGKAAFSAGGRNAETALRSVTLSASLTAIADNAFEYQTLLETVVLPDGVKDLGSWAFIGCTGLKNVVLPEKLERIGTNYGYTFSGCTGIEKIIIPAKVVDGYSFMFEGWTSEQTVYFRCPEKLFTAHSGKEEGITWNTGCDAQIVWGYTGD